MPRTVTNGGSSTRPSAVAVPVLRRTDGSLIGGEALIDKAHASTSLASGLKVDAQHMLTKVAAVCRDFGPDQAAARLHNGPLNRPQP